MNCARTAWLLLLGALVLVAAPARAQFRLEDHFVSADAWQRFEEPVNACATHASIASVSATSDQRLSVFANAAAAPHASHVIAQRRLLAAGPTGRWRIAVSVHVDAATLPLTQTGPELSLQSTRASTQGAEVRWRTHVAGLQYVGNRWSQASGRAWMLWTAVSTGSAPESEQASWVDLPTSIRLDRDGWYRLELELDYDTNRYVALTVRHEADAEAAHVDLSSWPIAREVKFTEPALWATLEAESLYDCAADAAPGSETRSTWQHEALYDDLVVEQLTGAIPSPPVARSLWLELHATESRQLALEELAADSDGDLDPRSVVITSAPVRGVASVGADGAVTYRSTEPGGDGFKLHVCDLAGACVDEWVQVSSPNRAPVAPPVRWIEAPSGAVRLPFPVVDLDGPLARAVIDVPPGAGVASVDGDAVLFTAPTDFVGQAALHSPAATRGAGAPAPGWSSTSRVTRGDVAHSPRCLPAPAGLGRRDRSRSRRQHRVRVERCR